MTTTADKDALLARILEDPADDAARLVYADVIEELGEDDRAAFIRLQCRKAWLETNCPNSIRQTSLDRDEYEMLMDREFRLLWGQELAPDESPGMGRANWSKWCWAESRADDGVPTRGSGSGGLVVTPAHHSLRSGRPPTVTVPTDAGGCLQVFCRGFVSGIGLGCGTFLTGVAASDLFQFHPVTRVAITDKWPLQIDDSPERGRREFVWFQGEALSNSSRHHLPGALAYDCRGRYETQDEAMTALSDACLRHARRVAVMKAKSVGPIVIRLDTSASE